MQAFRLPYYSTEARDEAVDIGDLKPRDVIFNTDRRVVERLLADGSAWEPVGLEAIYETIAQAEGIYGDVDMDGIVTQNDVALVLNAAVGNVDLTSEESERADVTDNDEVSAFDASQINQYIQGEIDTFEAGTPAPRLEDVLEQLKHKAWEGDTAIMGLGPFADVMRFLTRNYPLAILNESDGGEIRLLHLGVESATELVLGEDKVTLEMRNSQSAQNLVVEYTYEDITAVGSEFDEVTSLLGAHAGRVAHWNLEIDAGEETCTLAFVDGRWAGQKINLTRDGVGEWSATGTFLDKEFHARSERVVAPNIASDMLLIVRFSGFTGDGDITLNVYDPSDGSNVDESLYAQGTFEIV